MSPTLRLILVACVFLLAVSPARAQQGAQSTGYNISLHMPDGARFRYENDIDMEVIQTYGGKTNAFSSAMNARLVFERRPAAAPMVLLRAVYERIGMDVDVLGTKWTYHTEDTTGSTSFLDYLSGVIGQPFLMRLDAGGTIQDLDSLTGLTEAQKDSATDQNIPFNEKTIRSMLQLCINVYPDGPVPLKAKWNKKYTSNMNDLDILNDNTYQLKKVEDGVAFITLTGKLKLDARTSQMLQDSRMDMTGTQTGNLRIDLATGVIRTAEIRQEIKGAMVRDGVRYPMVIRGWIRTSGRTMDEESDLRQ